MLGPRQNRIRLVDNLIKGVCLMSTGNWILIGLVVLLILIVVFAKFYQKSSKDVAFVRTGLFGERVVLTGGKLAIPIVHHVTPVNMNTMRLDITRAKENALITKDRMRADIHAVFYVHVVGTQAGVAMAAQTLGARTLNPQAIQDLLKGKFVDALRTAAAEMDLDDLHEKGRDYVKRVRDLVEDVVTKNGLELESVSLSSMDQTSKEFFNPANTFDAVGLIKITNEIEDSRKKRNEIEKTTELKIQRTNLEAEVKSFDVKRESEYARLGAEKDIAERRAEHEAEIAQVQAERRSEAAEAGIVETEKVEKLRLASERTVAQQRIVMEQKVREAEIDKSKSLEKAEIERRQVVEIAKEESTIGLLEKQKERALAELSVHQATADSASAEESVNTAREMARAEREKSITLVKAHRVAEEKAIAIRLAAQAEKSAANDHAAAIEIVANGEAVAERVKLLAEAEGRQKINEAANLLSSEQVSMQVKMSVIQQLPEIIRESVKPLGNIDSIKIVDVNGVGINGNGSVVVDGGDGMASGSSDGHLVDKVVSGALKYRTQAPILDGLLYEVGLTDSQGSGLSELVTGKSSLLSKIIPDKK